MKGAPAAAVVASTSVPLTQGHSKMARVYTETASFNLPFFNSWLPASLEAMATERDLVGAAIKGIRSKGWGES